MEVTTPPKRRGQDMAAARAKSHEPLGLARRDLTWAEKAVTRVEQRYERDLAAAKVRLAKAQAKVRYFEELQQVEATAETGES